MRKLFAFAAAATLGLGSMAMAGQVNPQTYETTVNLSVAQEVSMWAAPAVSLTLDGKNAENSDAVASTISHINNVDAQITVKVDGGAGALANVNFFIFDNTTAAAATAAMTANSNAPAGAKKWTAATLGTSQPFTSVAKSVNVTNRPVVYAADAPNALPDEAAYALTVTWTIAAAP